MVVVTSLQKCKHILNRAGDRDYEVVMTYDSRLVETKPYFTPMDDMKAAWCKSSRRRVFLSLYGKPSLPAAWSNIPDVWVKVYLLHALAGYSRISYICWCDTDATTVPFLSDRKKNNYLYEKLTFENLIDVFRLYAQSPVDAFVGYRESSANHKLGQLHCSFNAGVFLIRCPAAKVILSKWKTYLPKRWPPRGPWAGPGYEQFEFDSHIADQLPNVALVDQRAFAENTATVRKLHFMHFYGSTLSLGKTVIGRWCYDVVARLSLAQRAFCPAFAKYAAEFEKRSQSKRALAAVKARKRNSDGIRKSSGETIKVHGKKFMSLRDAATSTGLSRRQLKKL